MTGSHALLTTMSVIMALLILNDVLMYKDYSSLRLSKSWHASCITNFYMIVFIA